MMDFQELIKSKSPAKLSDDMRQFIRTSFFSAAKQMGDYEFNYISNKIEQEISSTKQSSVEWLSCMSCVYSLLYDLISKGGGKGSIVSEKDFKLIGAALFYFVNPFDVIPDDTPAIGYVDDLYVLITCLEALEKEQLKSVENSFHSLRENQV